MGCLLQVYFKLWVFENDDERWINSGWAGATSGIGFEAAKALAERGARIVMPSLTMKEGEEAKAKIVALTPKARIVVMKLDLSDLNSVRNFVTEFKQTKLPLNVLMWVIS